MKTSNLLLSAVLAVLAVLSAHCSGIVDKKIDFGDQINKKAKKIYRNNKGSWEVDYGNGIVMVYIPPGVFAMGQNEAEKKWLIEKVGGDDYEELFSDEKPSRKVYLEGYWMGKTEVTNGQYVKFLNDHGIDYKNGCRGEQCIDTAKEDPDAHIKGAKGNYFVQPGFEDHPVIEVSWHGAAEYCRWLAVKTGLSFKLPTEAQWEKAARGTDGRLYPWGNHPTYYKGKWYANYKAHDNWKKKGDDGFQYTAPVGSYPQSVSPYGLLDMAGNVWEWCRDWFDGKYYSNAPANSPTGPQNGTRRVLRGGGWNLNARNIRCAYRGSGGPANRQNFLGFRLCQEKKQKQKQDD